MDKHRCQHRLGLPNAVPPRTDLACVLAIDREENMSLQPADEKDNHGIVDATAKRPYVALDLKKLSPKAALQWLESRSSSSDRATSQQMTGSREKPLNSADSAQLIRSPGQS